MASKEEATKQEPPKEETNPETGFPRFPNLAPELRKTIWEYAFLAIEDPPTLYFCAPKDFGLLAMCAEETNQNAIQPYVKLNMPLLFVNREARAAVMKMTTEAGDKLCFWEGKNNYIVVRKFKLGYDVLYYPASSLYRFSWHINWLAEDGFYKAEHVPKTAIAVPESMAYCEPREIHCIMNSYMETLKTIYLIFDNPAEIHLWTGGQILPPRWEIRDIPDNDDNVREFRWAESFESYFFNYYDEKFIGKEGVKRRMQTIRGSLLRAIFPAPDSKAKVYDESTGAFHFECVDSNKEKHFIEFKPIIVVKS